MIRSLREPPHNLTERWETAAVQSALAQFRKRVPDVEAEAIRIQQIPAPTFSEGARADYVQQRFDALGLDAVERDEVGNVYGLIPGQFPGPGLMVSAHLDTVFGPETVLTLEEKPNRLVGPGISDNSMGVAGLLALAEGLRQPAPGRDLWFVANVAEEGLGNLAGMRAAVERLQTRVAASIVLEGGSLGAVIHQGVGVQRRRLQVDCHGGHSWSEFGEPSAIHILSRIVAEIVELPVPSDPRTTFNVGMIEGGVSVNTIAPRATAILDLRSESPAHLDVLAAQVDAILRAQDAPGSRVTSEIIGERPAGQIAQDHPLVQVALHSLDFLGVGSEPHAASTDANVPLARGIPAICIGVAEGHNAHRTDEWLDRASLAIGLQHCFLVVRTAERMLP